MSKPEPWGIRWTGCVRLGIAQTKPYSSRLLFKRWNNLIVSERIFREM